ncbi:MAG: hypothetical protein WCR67_06910 [Bacilli bacterium]
MKNKKFIIIPLMTIIALAGCNSTSSEGSTSALSSTSTQTSTSTDTGTSTDAGTSVDTGTSTDASSEEPISDYVPSTENSDAGNDDGTSTEDEIIPSDTDDYQPTDDYSYTFIEDYSTILTDDILSLMADNQLPSSYETITDNSFVITAAGNYYLKGQDFTDITITLAKAGAVHIFLDGATITASKKAISTSKGETPTLVTITALEGSENTIVASQSGAKNAIDCSCNTVINGKGSMTVSSYNNALKSSSTMYVSDVTLNLSALAELDGHAISAQTVFSSNAKINVTSAGKDGIHAEIDDLVNDDDTFVLSST